MKIRLNKHIAEQLRLVHEFPILWQSEGGSLFDLEIPEAKVEEVMDDIYDIGHIDGYASGLHVADEIADSYADRRGRQFAAELAARDKGGHHAT